MAFCPNSCTCILCRSGGELDTNQLMKLQHIREQKLVINLVSYLKRWSQGDQQGFRVSSGCDSNGVPSAWVHRTSKMSRGVYPDSRAPGQLGPRLRGRCLGPGRCSLRWGRGIQLCSCCQLGLCGDGLASRQRWRQGPHSVWEQAAPHSGSQVRA